MRCLLVLLLLVGCSGTESPAVSEPKAPTAPIADLHFNDYELQQIAEGLVREARSRGIEQSPGTNRVERLLSLEASLGASDLALKRVNELTPQLTATDMTQWAVLRKAAEGEFHGRRDETGTRVNEMLSLWQRRKLSEAMSHLSSNYTALRIESLEWEKRFRNFVEERPIDAATWGWLVARECGTLVAQQYGSTDAESAYRFYLEFSGIGTRHDAQRIFSVPGTLIREAPESRRAPSKVCETSATSRLDRRVRRSQ